MQTKARKIEINLVTLGTGVILFGAWSFIKIVLTAVLYNDQFFNELSGVEIIIAYIFVVVFAMFFFGYNFT